MRRRVPRLALLVTSLSLLSPLVFGSGCGEDEAPVTSSLEVPRDVAVARGSVCMESVEPSPGVIQPQVRQCDEAERGAIGLIADQETDRVAVVDLARDMAGEPRRTPRLVDLDPSVPGTTGMKVGQKPVDVAAAGGTVAYSVDQADRSLSVINLWALDALSEAITFDRAPTEAVVTAEEDGESGHLAVALTDPGRLWVHPQLECDFPDVSDRGVVDRGAVSADDGCQDVPTQEDGEQLELPGRVADMHASPEGGRVFVVYGDKNFASVIALDDEAIGDGECRDGEEAPCEVERVGLTFGCSNDVDDDGDGDIDEDDPQCYGPRGAESPDGIGRLPRGECSDGEGDDRESDACLYSGGDEDEPVAEDVETVCDDGRDNDQDGAIDYPADSACYGEQGRSEETTTPTGFASVSTDELGAFLYAVDRGRNQLVVVDAQNFELIDAHDIGGEDRTPFASDLGIPIPGSPTAVTGTVDREIISPEEGCEDGGCDQAVVRYDYGAFVASDDDSAYQIDTMQTYCEVDAGDGEGVVSDDEFFAGSTALADSAESDCITVPDFPVDYDLSACEFIACEEEGDGDCDALYDGDPDGAEEACLGDRVFDEGDARLAVNPIFERRNVAEQESRLQGLGTCQTPETLTEQLREADGDTSCTSPFRAQPVEPTALEEDIEEADFDRARLLQKSRVELTDSGDGESEVVQSLSVDDFEAVSETWTVTYEGVLPGTDRDNAVVDEEEGLIDMGGVDLCESGVREGDTLTIRSEPTAEDDEIPEACEAFVDEESGPSFRTWRIDEVTEDEVVVETLDGEENDGEVTDELPSRECFAEGIEVEVRPDDEWIAVGDETGFVSDRTSVYGTCQPRYGAATDDEEPLNPRLNGRVDTGELFLGPYLSFELFEGAGDIEPMRGADEQLSYQFNVQRLFQSRRLATDVPLPTQILSPAGLPAGRLVIVPDPFDGEVYIRDLSLPSEEGRVTLN